MERMSRWDGMKDGDTETVELPFGEAVFQFEQGDPSVGIPGGVVVVALLVGGADFDRDQLDKVTAHVGGFRHSLATLLDAWAERE